MLSVLAFWARDYNVTQLNLHVKDVIVGVNSEVRLRTCWPHTKNTSKMFRGSDTVAKVLASRQLSSEKASFPATEISISCRRWCKMARRWYLTTRFQT